MIAQSMLPEIDHEMANTRRLLALVPDNRMDFKPHDRSWSLGDLAGHLCNLPTWGSMTLTTTEFDMNPVDGDPPRLDPFASMAAGLEAFDTNVRAFRDALSGADDDVLLVPWTLQSGGNAVFSMPRVAVLRSFVLNHMLHHRGQLTVYLRMCDIPLPELYGPTADST